MANQRTGRLSEVLQEVEGYTGQPLLQLDPTLARVFRTRDRGHFIHIDSDGLVTIIKVERMDPWQTRVSVTDLQTRAPYERSAPIGQLANSGPGSYPSGSGDAKD